MGTEQDEVKDVAPTSPAGFAAYQEIWRIVTARKWTLLFVMVLGLALGTGYCCLAGPWYDSSAQLLVIKKRLETAPISGPNQAHAQEDYLSTHMLLMASRQVIKGGIEQGNLRGLKQFRDEGGLKGMSLSRLARSLFGRTSDSDPDDRITAEIIASLVISRYAQKPGVNPSNEVINLSYRGRVADDCPKVLNAIIASYQAFLDQTDRTTNSETLDPLTQARDMVLKDLEGKEAAYQTFLRQTPPVWKGQDKNTSEQERLFKIDAQLVAMRLRKAELEASIEVIDQALKQGRNPTATVERILGTSSISRDPGTSGAARQDLAAGRLAARPPGSVEDELLNLQVQEAKLLAVRAPNHPDVQAVRAQMDNLRRLILPSTDEEDGPSDQSVREQDLGRLKVELLKQELADLTVAEKSLTKLFESEQKGVSAAYLREVQDETHRKGIERSRLLYEGILLRLKETSSVKGFGAFNTQVITPPLRGELAVKKYLLILGLSLFAGLALGVAWVCKAEFSARRIRQPARV